MNIDTGEIVKVNYEKLIKLQLKGNFVEIDESDMTEKQKREMRVSLNDNRSKLGKLRVQESKILNGNKRIKTRRNRKFKRSMIWLQLLD